MEKLVITKKEGITLWKVACEGIAPNTVVSLENGVMLLVTVDGQRYVCSKSSFTVNSLVNPGKNTKFLGGKKPYADCEIYAVDISSNFKSEWGVAGQYALNSYDEEFGVEAKAVAFGEYSYVVRDFFAFASVFSSKKATEISREDVREYFRSETVSVVVPYLSSKVGGGLKAAQTRLQEYSEDLQYHLNSHFGKNGIEVASFGIVSLDFEPAHKANREALKNAKVGVAIRSVVNEGRRDDISVEKEASEIDIGIINALNGNGTRSAKEARKIKCSRCGEENDGSSNYCYKCGESFGKK